MNKRQNIILKFCNIHEVDAKFLLTILFLSTSIFSLSSHLFLFFARMSVAEGCVMLVGGVTGGIGARY